MSTTTRFQSVFKLALRGQYISLESATHTSMYGCQVSARTKHLYFIMFFNLNGAYNVGATFVMEPTPQRLFGFHLVQRHRLLQGSIAP